MSVATVKRRGSLRAISSLPAAPAGTQVMEVDVGGGAFQAPVPSGSSYFNQTVLQLPFAADFVDATGHTLTITGAVAIDATQNPVAAKFSGGNLAYANRSPITDWDLSRADWTIEGWFKTTQTGTQFATLIERSVGSGNCSWELLINNGSSSDGKLAMYVGWESSPVVVSTAALNDGVRHHFAIQRCGNEYMMFIDGILVAHTIFTTTDTATASTGGILVGCSATASRVYSGWLDNLRHVKGAAVYTRSGFTPPTPPFPTS